MAQWLGTGFPYGTLLVNVAGCLAIGFLGALVTDRLVARPEIVRMALIVGFLGSLTTFSSFGWETNGLFQDGEAMRAVVNIVVSVVSGLVAVRAGIVLAGLLGMAR